ncbi:deoxyribonuclease IV [Patescibacteria group bacterium]|nr:deoxyribonuclease IV [Patescibacteria group bacterium]
MLIGYHVSAAGGLHKAIAEAEIIGCTAIQIFVGSPQVWQTPEVDLAVVKKFKGALSKSKVKKVLVHSAYLPNPASHKNTLRRMSLKKMKEEIRVAYAIGADGYNFHCGSNQNSNEEGLKLATETLNRLAELSDEKYPIPLIIENDAGAGNRIGDTIEELAQIWRGIKNKKRFGFCLDTCHLFVSGIDLRTKKDIDALVKKFDKLIGIQHLKFIHVNDALFELGSKKDRHALIGQGYVGTVGFKALLHHPKLRTLPFIMETPYGGDSKGAISSRIKELKFVKKLAR